MPPIDGYIVRSLTSSETLMSSATSVVEMIRLRDIWDASLKKILDIIFE